jgi:hypothetical protein
MYVNRALPLRHCNWHATFTVLVYVDVLSGASVPVHVENIDMLSLELFQAISYRDVHNLCKWASVVALQLDILAVPGFISSSILCRNNHLVS